MNCRPKANREGAGSVKTVALEQAMRNTLARIRRMTPEEQRRSLIDAGILTREGELTAPYR